MNLFQPNVYGDLVPAIAALAANGDPISSHEAAYHLGRSPRAHGRRELVLRLITEYPGSTAWELWDQATAAQREQLENPVELWRRGNDLRRLGLVQNGEELRMCRVRRRRILTWFPVATNCARDHP
jgi:hypothetical protein